MKKKSHKNLNFKNHTERVRVRERFRIVSLSLSSFGDEPADFGQKQMINRLLMGATNATSHISNYKSLSISPIDFQTIHARRLSPRVSFH
jgi:hypothetical protein